MHYWSPPGSGETEVDFLVRRGDQFVAIEVTDGSHFSDAWTKRPKAVATLLGLTRRLIVTPNPGPLVTANGIEKVSFVQMARAARTDRMFL